MVSATTRQSREPATTGLAEQKGLRKVPGKVSRPGRLLKHADFERVYQQGQRHFGRLLTAFFVGRELNEKSGAKRDSDSATAGELRAARIGFTVGRGLGGSVQRNRIKRRMREAVRLQREQLSVSVDVVFNPKKAVLKADFSEVSREVARAFQVITLNSGRKP
jgi:ribonuclease P protein component